MIGKRGNESIGSWEQNSKEQLTRLRIHVITSTWFPDMFNRSVQAYLVVGA